MLPVNMPQPKMTGSTLSVFGLGVFSGGATACCAPVLAGAIALSATSGTIAGGLLLGAAYVAGMMAPLIPLALLFGKARTRVKDPKLTLRLGSYSKRIGAMKLLGVDRLRRIRRPVHRARADRKRGHGTRVPALTRHLDARTSRPSSTVCRTSSRCRFCSHSPPASATH